MFSRRHMLAGLASLKLARPALAQTLSPIRVGVLTDLSSVFTDSTGLGSIAGVRMAIEEMGATLLGRPVELVQADHQNKPELAAEIAKRWYTQDGVEVIADLPNSSAALAVQEVSRQARKIALQTSSGVEDISGRLCSPYGFQWAWDTWSQANVIATAAPKTDPNTWYVLAADYSFGIALEQNLKTMIAAKGGKVIGSARHPMMTADLSSYLLQAQASGAKTLVLAAGGVDAVNSLKQAAEFGLVAQGMHIIAASTFIVDIHAAGLQVAQGLILPESFYWDRDDASRAWSAKFAERRKTMPNVYHVSAYSAVRHWMRAVAEAGTLDAPAVAAHMRALPVRDVFARDGHVREDNRMVHDVMLVQVKTPAESKKPWDYYKILSTVPGEEAVRPIADSVCPFVKHV